MNKALHSPRVLVEPACGASLAAVYAPVESLKGRRDILIVVCGGVGVTIQQLEHWRKELQMPDAGEAHQRG